MEFFLYFFLFILLAFVFVSSTITLRRFEDKGLIKEIFFFFLARKRFDIRHQKNFSPRDSSRFLKEKVKFYLFELLFESIILFR